MTVAAEPSRTKTNVSGSRRGPWGLLRTRLAGLAATVGVLLGALVLASPASAQPGSFEHWIAGGGGPYIEIGGTTAIVTVDVRAKHNNPAGLPITVSASLSNLNGYASVDVQSQDPACSRTGVAVAQCHAVLPGQTVRLQFTIASAPESDLPQGQTKTGKLKINGGGQSSGVQETTVTVAGKAGPETATDITGTITSNAEPVADAKVVLTDAEGTEHETTTNDKGEFAFQGTAQKPIAPGEMTLKVTKEGFEDYQETIEVAANSGFQKNLTLIPVQAEPTETTEAPTTEAAPSPTPEATDDKEDEGGISGTLLVLIIVGGLLVVGGIVGIVFLLRGGKDEDKDDGESFAPDSPPEHQPTAAQVGSPGVYQAGPAPGQDAPTMVHNGPLVQDQEVGSYGAPAPTSAFGPSYGPGGDATQVMPQAGTPSAPPPPPPPAPSPSPPPVGPGDTQILSTVKGLDNPGSVPPPPMGDATQVMPQANMSSRPPQSSFSEPGATQPYQSPTPPPPQPPSQPPTGAQPSAPMFEPQQPAHPASGSQPPVSRDPYAPPPSPSPAPAPSPQPSPSPQPGADPYPSRGLSRDPYAPPPSPSPTPSPAPSPQPSPQPGADPYGPPSRPASGPPAADPYSPAPTRQMPQGGPGEPQYGTHSQQPPSPSPYAADRPADEDAPNSRHRSDEERRGWGEWDDRPRSW